MIERAAFGYGTYKGPEALQYMKDTKSLQRKINNTYV